MSTASTGRTEDCTRLNSPDQHIALATREASTEDIPATVRDIALVADPKQLCSGMFAAAPKARADLAGGTLYAVSGESNWIYYGQVTPAKRIAFFRRRDREVPDPDEVMAASVMSQVVVAYPSIGRAVRSGAWRKLGRFPLRPDLLSTPDNVQWPVGTLMVMIWSGRNVSRTTRVEDPAIQELEINFVWDAVAHIPKRLTADFGTEPAAWHVGGPVWRERRVKEAYADRFPDTPWHRLPADWVRSSVQ